MTAPRHDTEFYRSIRTSPGAQPQFPVMLQTVEQALDHVQELPLPLLSGGPWRKAWHALWGAVDLPGEAASLMKAESALRIALETEGWLDDIPPA